MRITWDEKNAEEHWRKHRISFKKAAEVFNDPNCKTVRDNRFDYGEVRYNTLGMADDLLLLVVSHTYKDEDDNEIIRIISARAAKPHEWRIYGNRKL
ncbi:MAG: BrnT family toxin [Holophagaceae bacterium]|nr:BrnT family toxin [Holophagaceae bacterium]